MNGSSLLQGAAAAISGGEYEQVVAGAITSNTI
jgi:hypothetical protein